MVTVGALNGYSGTVGLSASGLPSGVSAGFSPVSVVGSGSSTLTLTVGAGTAAGTYPVTITGSDGSLSHTANVSLTVTPAPDFTVSATPSSRSIASGSSATFTLTVGALNGFTGTVGFGTSTLPTGLGASFTPATVTSSGT